MTAKIAVAVLANLGLTGGASGQTHSVLASYTDLKAHPSGGLIADGMGGYIGVAAAGTNGKAGSIVRFTPNGAGQPWAESVVYAFAGGADGAYPQGKLVADGLGGFLGATFNGGTAGLGTVFRVVPPAISGGAWTHTVIYNFQGGGADAAGPHGNLVADGNGGFFGPASHGSAIGGSAVYKIVAPATASGSWTEQIVALFSGNASIDTLALDPSGPIYVSVLSGGTSRQGEIVELTPPTEGGLYSQTVLHKFVGGHGSTDGLYPHYLTLSGGVLYGVTAFGGTNMLGTFYSLTPGASGWTETVLYNFAGGVADGASPASAFTPDGNGGYFAVTNKGGAANAGTVVDLVPSGGLFTDRLVYSFLGGTDGANPIAGMIPIGDGVFYGVTNKGGAKNAGTFYSVVP